MMTQPGLRERKKVRTRDAIRTAALALFAKHGFEKVTVAQVADRADVSEATVFNYFPTKEELVLSRLEDFRAEMLAAVRDRADGVSATTAFRDFLMPRRPIAGSADELDRLRTVNRIITGSPALLARERLVDDHSTAELAGLLATESRAPAGDVRPWVVAHALVGAHRSLILFTRAQVLDGVGGPLLTRRVRAQATRAFALLDQGLAGYPRSASTR